MDGLSSVASVIAVIQLAGSLAKICGGYIQEVKDAREQIVTLQQAVTGLQGTVQDLQRFLQKNNENALPTSSRLGSNINDCLSDLRALKAELDPGKGNNLMRKVGFRALKWPLKRTEVESVVRNLERYKSAFLLSLQVDQTSLIINVAQNTDRIYQHMDLGKIEIATEAEFDSFSDRDEVNCLQGTRTKLLQQIMEWAASPNQKIIFWLNGMAGTGKSTISRTVAKAFKDTNHLGASFFFKRGEGDRGNAKKFFPTLTRQLVLRISELGSSVQNALQNDPEIASKSLSEQFTKLLLQPLLDLDGPGRRTQTAVIVIVIDALDECEHDPDVRNIVRLLPLLQKVNTVRLRVFLTSRPELPIRLGFSEIADRDHQDLALHEISDKVTEHDIRLFLIDRFTKIRSDRKISEDWPSDDVIQDLVTMSVPLFISAATVCRYIGDSKWEPKRRLAELLQDQARYATKMEKTYLPILTRLLDDQESDELEKEQLMQEFQKIIGVLILLAVPFSINTYSRFLSIEPGLISNRLDSFQSVLSIPANRDMPVRILHLSFRDFLVQSCGKFRVDESKTHKEIALHCLETMRSRLQKNICNLESPGTHRADVDPQSLRHYVPPELEYSCRYWIYHLEQSEISSPEIQLILLFLQEHFLHWVEAMSLLGLVSEVVGMLNLLQMIIPGDQQSTISDFLQDAKRFILKNRQIADEAPLQLYCAGLIFAPQISVIRREFKAELPTWICQLPQVEEGWSAELQALEGHLGPVQSVAFSPDSRMLVSGSTDKTIRLWDSATGALQQALEGYLGLVQSVAFSPDSRLLASGSGDETVRLWDSATGVLQQTLEGHSSSVESVAFSPDGRLLASGSDDMTVRLWDVATGALEQILEGHSHWVHSVTFSPDGLLLASGSDDMTVRLWDVATGALQQTLEGHSQWVHSVAFSPDGRLLASGSDDMTVRLWDVATGALEQILEGHSHWVHSVTFSPDGLLLASGSADKTVRLWDVATGALQQTLEGHSRWVHSVAFSPDGRLLASGSDDMTVRLWDATTFALQQTLEGHSHWARSVESVAFSPDGRLLTSGSGDQTVRLWDSATGVVQQILEGHSDSVQSMAFSPDGRLLASGSNDKTVRLWDVATGVLQQTLLGHLDWADSVAFSPDGRVLASGSVDMTMRLWNVATGVLQQTLEGHSGSVQSMAFSPGGRLLASASRDRKVRLWDLATGALQQTLEGHLYPVQSVAFTSDGRLLASGSVDQTVRLWDVATGALQQTLEVGGPINYLDFAQDGSYLMTNLGALDFQSRSEIKLTHRTVGVFIEQGQWIKLNGYNTLWLPPDSRPGCSAFHGNLLALGHASGRVSFIGFHL